MNTEGTGTKVMMMQRRILVFPIVAEASGCGISVHGRNHVQLAVPDGPPQEFGDFAGCSADLAPFVTGVPGLPSTTTSITYATLVS